MLEKGWICPSMSPYGAPLLFVCKKRGKLRICIDYSALNRQTKLDVFPIPRIADLLDCLGRACFFSLVDLATAYHQIRIEQGHEHRTAFATPQGLYEWIVCLFVAIPCPVTYGNPSRYAPFNGKSPNNPLGSEQQHCPTVMKGAQ